MDVNKPDEKSIMTYIAQFLKAYPEMGTGKPMVRKLKRMLRKFSSSLIGLIECITMVVFQYKLSRKEIIS